MTTKITISKDSYWHEGRIRAVKKLGDNVFGCYCACGAKLRLNKRELIKGDFPHDCDSEPVTGTALAIVDNAAKMTKLKNRLSKLDSVFKDEVAGIQDMLNSSNSDSAISKFQKIALSTLMELIPIAEEKYRQFGNERAAYALNSLISQARELVGDIKAERDSRGIALHLSHAIIHPAMISIMQNVVDNMYQLKKGVEAYVPANRARDTSNLVDQSAREIAHYLEQSYNQIRDRIVTEMMET